MSHHPLRTRKILKTLVLGALLVAVLWAIAGYSKGVPMGGTLNSALRA